MRRFTRPIEDPPKALLVTFSTPFFWNSSFFLFFSLWRFARTLFHHHTVHINRILAKWVFVQSTFLQNLDPLPHFRFLTGPHFRPWPSLSKKKLFFTFPTARPEPAQSSPRQRPPNIGPLPPFQDTKEARSRLPYCRGPRPRATESGRHDVLPPQMIIFSSFLNPVFASAHRMIIFQKKSFLRSTFTPPPPPPTPPPHPPFLF